MRCGGRFGKGILREGLGQGHLTEGPRPDRTRLRALPLDETRGESKFKKEIKKVVPYVCDANQSKFDGRKLFR